VPSPRAVDFDLSPAGSGGVRIPVLDRPELETDSLALTGRAWYPGLTVNRPKEQRNPNKLQFLTSAADLRGCPPGTQPEVAIVGRSNAGKSSLINGISGARIAQVSSAPGKTRLLNFYQTAAYRLVDMPGYGFAARAGDEQKAWRRMIEPYLATRSNLVGLLIVMDIRRDWSEDEVNLLDWMRPRGLPSALVLTKADKLTRSEINQRLNVVRKQSGLDGILVTSATAKIGMNEVEEFVFAQWVKR